MNKYVCICGKEFTSSQSFNGHKSHCPTHQRNKYGNLDTLKSVELTRKQNAYKVRNKLQKQKLEQTLSIWIAEKHTCERCGKIMTEKFGSGRFCSKSCANARTKDEESKLKVANTLHTKALLLYKQNPRFCATCGNELPYENRHNLYCSEQCYPNNTINKKNKYYQNPNRCNYCGNVLPYEHRHRTYCGNDCRYKSLSRKQRTNYKEGKLDHITVNHTYKYGTYQGISCDSSWELAFVIYNIDHNIKFKRNKSISFEYEYKGEIHNFFPDFIVGDTFVEIKNRHSDITDCKINGVPENVKFKIIYSKGIKKYLDYVFEKYGPNWIELYDRNYPSWMDKVE